MLKIGNAMIIYLGVPIYLSLRDSFFGPRANLPVAGIFASARNNLDGQQWYGMVPTLSINGACMNIISENEWL